MQKGFNLKKEPKNYWQCSIEFVLKIKQRLISGKVSKAKPHMDDKDLKVCGNDLTLALGELVCQRNDNKAT